MLHRLADSVQIVDPDIADPRARRPDINEDQRHLPEFEVLKQHFFHTEGQDRNAFHPALDHSAYGALHPFRVVPRRGQQDFIAVLDRDGFEYLNDFWKEWVGDFGNNETENPAAPGNQRPRLRIRVVTQFLDDAPDALRQGRIDRGDAIDRTGHGSGRNLGAFRYFPYVHKAWCRGSSAARNSSMANVIPGIQTTRLQENVESLEQVGSAYLLSPMLGLRELPAEALRSAAEQKCPSIVLPQR